MSSSAGSKSSRSLPVSSRKCLPLQRASSDMPTRFRATWLLIAVFVAVCNLIVDLLYAVIDPRVRAK